MQLNHEGVHICECEMWEESPVFYPIAELIQCKDCMHSIGEPIADGRYWCKENCGYFQFCSEGKRREE